MKPSTTFRQQLIHWSIHIPIWAIPSLIVMSSYERGSESLAVMIFGIITFTLLFSALAASFLPTQSSHLLLQAIRWGSRLRTGLSLIFIPISLAGNLDWMFPDLVAGYISVQVTSSLCQSLGITTPAISLFSATMLQASLITLGFLLLTLGSYLVIRFVSKPKITDESNPELSPLSKSQTT